MTHTIQSAKHHTMTAGTMHTRIKRWIAFLFVALSFVTIQQMCSTFKTTNKTTTSKNTHEVWCEKMLDELEHKWDLRKNARIDKIKNDPHSWPDLTKFDAFEPEAVCFDEERFGSKNGKRHHSWGDGPKFVCGVDRLVEKAQNTNDCLIYSVGSNNNVDFEKSCSSTFGKHNCEIHTFDPTVPPNRYVGTAYSTFHDWGFGQDGQHANRSIKGRGNFNFTLMSLETVMKKLGHQGRTIDILKIDCEGCEYVAVTQAFEAIANGTVGINQIQVEVHAAGDHAHWKEDLIAFFNAADGANMRVFHKERNHWGCQGKECVEYAFVSNDFLRKANGYYIC